MRAMLVAALLFAVALGGAQAQQMYRWVDTDGRVHYTQQPPPAEAKNVLRRSAASGAADAGDLPYATQLAAKNYPVTLFTAADCGQGCKEARASLEKRGVPFDEVVVGDDQSVADLRRLTGKTQVPVLRVGTQFQVGYEPEAWKAALDTARYPASGPPARGRFSGTAPNSLPAVKLYTAAECGGLCEEARNTLAARRIKFQEITVTYDNPETVDELKRVAGGSEAVPVLVVGQRVQRGFDSGTYQSVLDAAGFPNAEPTAGTPAAKP
jgi:glutaredoxin